MVGDQTPSPGSRIRRGAETASLLLLGAVALAWVALWNGYPLLAGDTAGYLKSAFEGGVEARRPSLYPYLVAILSMGRSLWPVVAFQCLLASAALYLLASHVNPARRHPSFLAAVLVAAMLTPLPWFTGRIMPDVFAGILGIAIWILLFAGPAPSRPVRLLLLAVVFLGVACHVANIPLVMGGLALGIAARRLLGFPIRPILARSAAVAAVAALAALAICAANWQANGAFALSTEPHAFTMARLVRYGVVQRMLDERCEVTAYALCPYRNELSTAPDHYLFSPDSPLSKIGGAAGSREASLVMIDDAMRHYPMMQAAMAMRAAVEQFGLVRLGMGLGTHSQPMLAGPHHAVRSYLPGEHPDYLAGRQRNGRLEVARFNGVIVPATWAALALATIIALLEASGRRKGRRSGAGGAIAFLLLWLVANAAVMGILSSPFDRYQARVAWLLPTALAIALAHRTLLDRLMSAVSRRPLRP